MHAERSPLPPSTGPLVACPGWRTNNRGAATGVSPPVALTIASGGPEGSPRSKNLSTVRIRQFLMSLSQNEPNSSKKSKYNEPGAFAAWGLVAGAVVGAIAGAFFGRSLIGAIFLGTILWIAGALLERSRM